MTDEPDEKVKSLPVRFKERPGTSSIALKVVETYGRDGCNHQWFFDGNRMVDVTYLIRSGETEVECGNCHTRLDPMWVLKRMAGEESQWRRAEKRYQDEMQRLSERQKTRCQRCGGMTRISHTKPRKKT